MTEEKAKELDAVDRGLQYLKYLVQSSLVLAALLTLFVPEVRSITTALISLLVLALSFLPDVIERRYRIDIPLELELYTVLFIYASLFLGELGQFYARFWWWDAFLHTTSAAVFGLIAFMFLYVLYYQGKLRTSPFVIAVLTFSFAVMIGSMWEIFEFTLDNAFGLNTQKSGLADTMGDLIVDAIGAGVTAVLGYYYIAHEKAGIIHRIMQKFFRDNPRLAQKVAERKRRSRRADDA